MVGQESGRWATAASWVETQLGRRGAHAVIIAFSLFATLPVLSLSLDSDDHFQVASLARPSVIPGTERAPWDLYAFARDRSSNIALREAGVWSWWSDVDVVLRLFRPLSSLSRWLDHQLWPGHVALMELHSLAWFALLLLTVSQLYRELLPSPWLSALALALFALDESRGATIGWLCNRNALIALAFGFSALSLHHRWRAHGDRGAAWLAPICLALGLAGGEAALQIGGYLLAYALLLDSGSARARLASLLPSAFVLLGWAVLYKALGYGARGSAIYNDPLQDPLAFLALLPERLVIYALALYEGVSADWFNLLPLLGVAPRPRLLPLAIVCALLLIAALVPLCRRDRLARFWALGTVLAAIPTCSVTPSDRMLTGAALGGMALLALLFGALVEGSYPQPRRWLFAFAGTLAFLNLLVAPALRPRLLWMLDDFEQVLAYADKSIPSDPSVRDETVVLLNPPYDGFGTFFPLYRATYGIPRPKHFRWLATGVSSLRVERVDAHTLKLAPSNGFLANSSTLMLRSLDQPMRRGERVELSGVSFEVLSLTEDARPQEVLVRFDRPLESRSLRILQWGKHEYVPFVPPPVGSAVVVPAVDMVTALSVPSQDG